MIQVSARSSIAAALALRMKDARAAVNFMFAELRFDVIVSVVMVCCGVLLSFSRASVAYLCRLPTA